NSPAGPPHSAVGCGGRTAGRLMRPLRPATTPRWSGTKRAVPYSAWPGQRPGEYAHYTTSRQICKPRAQKGPGRRGRGLFAVVVSRGGGRPRLLGDLFLQAAAGLEARDGGGLQLAHDLGLGVGEVLGLALTHLKTAEARDGDLFAIAEHVPNGP